MGIDKDKSKDYLVWLRIPVSADVDKIKLWLHVDKMLYSEVVSTLPRLQASCLFNVNPI